jgi:hypothetical protein
MQNRLVVQAALFFIILCIPGGALAQEECKSPQFPLRNISDYLEERICKNLQGRVDQTDPTKQSAAPAAAANSTSLVERSSAPDLLGFGLDFLNLSDASGQKKSATPKTLTFSAYALKSALSSQDPLDPEIYNKNKMWRSVSFTVGYDVPEKTNTREPIIGIKWLAYNGRDVSSSDNQKQILKIRGVLNSSTTTFSVIRRSVTRSLFAALEKRGKLPPTPPPPPPPPPPAVPPPVPTAEDNFEDVLTSPTKFELLLTTLTDDEKKSIDQIVSNNISAFANLDAVTKDAVTAIRAKAQLALSFTTTQRKGKRPDEYAGTLTFDKGMGTNSITMNGSFIQKKTPGGKDSNGGQFAAAFHIPLNAFKPLGYKDPLLLSIEANATGMTDVAPIYKAQAKLTIPLLAGMEIPISVSVANRTEFIKEKEVKGKFGFTFDLSKVMKSFRDNFARIQ